MAETLPGLLYRQRTAVICHGRSLTYGGRSFCCWTKRRGLQASMSNHNRYT